MRRWTIAAARFLAFVGVSAVCAGAVPALAKDRLPYDLARLRLAGVIADEDGRSKIVGGKTVEPGNKYPFQVALIAARAGSGQERLGQFCGGSLIADTWVLTASHCVVMEGDVSGELIYLGPKDIDVYTGSANFRKGDRIKVKKVIAHRSFKLSTMNSDVALIQLTRPPKRGWKAKPIDYKAAAADPSLSADGKITTVIGWGLVDDKTLPNALREVSVPIASNKVCDNAIRTFRINEAKKKLDEMAEMTNMDDATYQNYLKQIESYTGGIDDTMMCAGLAEGGKDSCQGDSGGPLFVTDADGKFHQVGVVSWGYGCGLPDVRGVYARLGQFKDWIEQNMGVSQ
ncbi:MAG: serine protease [Parvibaculaceae bacterium]